MFIASLWAAGLGLAAHQSSRSDGTPAEKQRDALIESTLAAGPASVATQPAVVVSSSWTCIPGDSAVSGAARICGDEQLMKWLESHRTRWTVMISQVP